MRGEGARQPGGCGGGSDPPLPRRRPAAVAPHCSPRLPLQDFVASREMTLFLIDAGPSMLEPCDLPDEEVRPVCRCLFLAELVGAGAASRIGGLAQSGCAPNRCLLPFSLQAWQILTVFDASHLHRYVPQTQPHCHSRHSTCLPTPLAHPARLQAFAGMTWLEVAVRVAAEIMRQKIIASSGDQIGVALYGTVSA